jgi:hypothetical protein
MWWRRQAVVTGRQLRFPLAELLCNWQHVYLPGARAAFGPDLTSSLLATIRQRVRHGEWPTRLPVEFLLENLTDRIIAETGSGAAASAEAVEKIQEQAARLERVVGDRATGRVQLLIDRIEHFDLAADRAEREQMRRSLARAADDVRASTIGDLTAAVRSLEQAQQEVVVTLGELGSAEAVVSANVKKLSNVDGDLARSVDALERTDGELTQVVERLVELDLTTSRSFVLTFKASSGALGPLIDFVADGASTTKLPSGIEYDFDREHSPYARSGRIGSDEDFPQFIEHLEQDLNAAYLRRREIVAPGRHNWEEHELAGAVVTVWPIGRKVPLEIGPRALEETPRPFAPVRSVTVARSGALIESDS